MLTLQQVRLLEQRVQRVISRLVEVQRENETLRGQLSTYQERIDALEARVESVTTGHAEIEQSILNALHHLDEVEDAVGGEGAESRVISEIIEDEGTSDDVRPADPTTDTDDTDDSRDAPGEQAADTPAEQPPQREPVPAPEAVAPRLEESVASELPEDDESEAEGTDGPELDIF